jgi:hypothetical protein
VPNTSSDIKSLAITTAHPRHFDADGIGFDWGGTWER